MPRSGGLLIIVYTGSIPLSGIAFSDLRILIQVRFHSYIAEDSKVVSLSHVQLGPNVVGNRGLTPSEQKTCQHCCYMYLAFPRKLHVR